MEFEPKVLTVSLPLSAGHFGKFSTQRKETVGSHTGVLTRVVNDIFFRQDALGYSLGLSIGQQPLW